MPGSKYPLGSKTNLNENSTRSSNVTRGNYKERQETFNWSIADIISFNNVFNTFWSSRAGRKTLCVRDLYFINKRCKSSNRCSGCLCFHLFCMGVIICMCWCTCNGVHHDCPVQWCSCRFTVMRQWNRHCLPFWNTWDNPR